MTSGPASFVQHSNIGRISVNCKYHACPVVSRNVRPSNLENVKAAVFWHSAVICWCVIQPEAVEYVLDLWPVEVMVSFLIRTVLTLFPWGLYFWHMRSGFTHRFCVCASHVYACDFRQTLVFRCLQFTPKATVNFFKAALI